MNLFALTTIPGARILRFPLTADLQAQLQGLFEDQLNLFEVNVAEIIPFDGRYTPEEGELLRLDDFQDVDGLTAAAENPLDVELFDPTEHPLDAVKALFTGFERNNATAVLIQYFERRRLIANKGIAMFFSGNTFHRMSDSGLTFDNRLLAVLEGGSLKFQSFHFLSRVFDLSEFYREATNDEVEAFATHEKMAVADLQNFLASAGPLIRKKISLISQSGILEQHTTEQLVAVAQIFNVPMNVNEHGRIILPTNKTELRQILRFLDEDYYESPLSQSRFVSNSKRRAD
ncbi:Kiwa anti-phage protein KwaB-like domain-containing protein [Paraburkholderia phymatum]|uniref:Kiwa anti-phage protein KwaB-like domain-containing protein n=1 Tax=Paraburkholderia phymatum TaxID=148447 RepID=UPI00317D9384